MIQSFQLTWSEVHELRRPRYCIEVVEVKLSNESCEDGYPNRIEFKFIIFESEIDAVFVYIFMKFLKVYWLNSLLNK